MLLMASRSKHSHRQQAKCAKDDDGCHVPSDAALASCSDRAPISNRLAAGDGIFSSIHHFGDDPSRTHRFEWDRTALTPYRSYSKLLGERKFSLPHPPKTFAFLSLPAELRDQIYRLSLLLEPPYIELAAKTSAFECSNDPAIQHHLSRLRKVRDSLGLLRLNKQIRSEASAIYYGEHEWRFSNVKGIYVLDTFLQQIGQYNQRLLKTIALHVPWRGHTNDNWRDDLPESISRLDLMRQTLQSMGLHPSKHDWHFNKRRCLRRIVRTLEEHGALTKFSLVLPDTFEIAQPTPKSQHLARYDYLLEPARFEGLQLRLVVLHAASEDSSTSSSGGDQQDARMPARASCIEVVDAEYDVHGYWTILPTSESSLLDLGER